MLLTIQIPNAELSKFNLLFLLYKPILGDLSRHKQAFTRVYLLLMSKLSD